MALVVQKFGGTSVGSIDRILAVARRVLDVRRRGDDVVVVVSAMAGETNRLVSLATQIDPIPYSKAYDLLISSGEQVSVGLLSLAIDRLAREEHWVDQQGRTPEAEPFLAYRLGLRTNSIYSKARIESMDTEALRGAILQGRIPVVAGFQGLDPNNQITTLGRGGSDTSAVAVAAALRADECEIYTDVDGVYTTDPRLCADARRLKQISYEEMMEFASLGAKVLQIRSVELAAKYRMKLWVKSSFEEGEGTAVVSREQLDKGMETVLVSGVAADRGQVRMTLSGFQERLDVPARIFGALADEAINVDVIVMDLSSDSANPRKISFTVADADRLKTERVLKGLQFEVEVETGLAKVSIIGVGMQNHFGVAARMFEILAEAGIEIRLISTSEIKISCLVAEDRMKEAVQRLHSGFDLAKLD